MKRVYRRISSLFTEQSGVAKILVAFSMIMIIGFTALVVDAGGLFYEKSRLQKTLDAAVLGGAQVLKVSEAEAEAVAIDLGTKNGFTISKGEVSTGSYFIEIDKTVNKDLTFAKVLGFKDTGVRLFARAEIDTLIRADEAIPLLFERKVLEAGEYGQEYRMSQDPNTRGNFGFLRIGEKGNNLVNDIEDGIPLKVGESENTEPGNISTPIRKAFEDRITDDIGKNHCNDDYATADNTCRRLVTVALVETYENLKGTSEQIKIIGLAVFWIKSAVKVQGDNIVTGSFVEFLIDEEYGGSKGYKDNEVKLVK